MKFNIGDMVKIKEHFRERYFGYSAPLDESAVICSSDTYYPVIRFNNGVKLTVKTSHLTLIESGLNSVVNNLKEIQKPNNSKKLISAIKDKIDPAHYKKGKIEVIEFIEDQNLGYHLGNVIKYVCRAGFKQGNSKEQDLRKAIWYLERELSLDKGDLNDN